MGKVISCGIIIKNSKNQILGCYPHGRKDKRHDVPKGKMDEGETYIQTAIRECFEETGLRFNEEDLKGCGLSKYIRRKDLYLFEAKLEIEDLSKLNCSTYHEINGSLFKEVTSYKWVDSENIEKEFFKPLVEVFRNIGIIY